MKSISLLLIIFSIVACKKANNNKAEIIQETPNPYVELIKGIWVEDSTQTLTSISPDTFEVTSDKFIFSQYSSFYYDWSPHQDDIFGLWGDTQVNLLNTEIFIWTNSYYMLENNSPVSRHYCHRL